VGTVDPRRAEPARPELHEIETAHVTEALKPIWWEKPISVNRTCERIEKLLDAAKVEKFRTGENPAAWRGNLKFVLPSARKLNKKKGHASVPYSKAPALMTTLRYEPGNAARCVEVGILTCARSQEIRLMEWDEIDFDAKQWTCPAEKMKIKDESEPKPHLVPLSDQAIEIIKSMPRVGRYVFSSDHAEEHQPFFPNALTNVIKRAGFNATMHRCRTTFRNWGGESTEHNFRREVLEHYIAHRVGDESEKSYWTGEMIERRREVLQDFIKPRTAFCVRTHIQIALNASQQSQQRQNHGGGNHAVQAQTDQKSASICASLRADMAIPSGRGIADHVAGSAPTPASSR
jgi:integrase